MDTLFLTGAGTGATIKTAVIAVADIGARAGAVDLTTQSVVVTGGILASLLNTSVAKALFGPGRRTMAVPAHR